MRCSSAGGKRRRRPFRAHPHHVRATRLLSQRPSRRGTAAPGIDLYATDRLEDLARDWPRGKSQLTLAVERDGRIIDLEPFSPRTIGLYPTQLYETVSMVLLILLLLAFYPFRRHDGQLFVLLMIGYAVHRFINESLRIEPIVFARTDALAVGQRDRFRDGRCHRDLPVVRHALAMEGRRFTATGAEDVSASPAGYSDTPLWKKLGIRESGTILTVNAPAGYRNLLPGLPKGVAFVTEAEPPLAFVHLFVESVADLAAPPRAESRPRGGWHNLGVVAQEGVRREDRHD